MTNTLIREAFKYTVEHYDRNRYHPELDCGHDSLVAARKAANASSGNGWSCNVRRNSDGVYVHTAYKD